MSVAYSMKYVLVTFMVVLQKSRKQQAERERSFGVRELAPLSVLQDEGPKADSTVRTYPGCGLRLIRPRCDREASPPWCPRQALARPNPQALRLSRPARR